MLVTSAELATYMDVRFSNRQEDASELVLAGLQSEMEGYLRRPVEPTAFDETYRVDGGFVALPNSSFFYQPSIATNLDSYVYVGPVYTLPLNNTPIASITSVQVKGTNVETWRTMIAERDYIVRSFGIELYWVAPNDSIRVQYTAGLEGDSIAALKLFILRAATREMQNMHDDVVGVKDLNTRNVAPLQTGFTDSERQAMRKWRRVRVA